MAHLFNAVAFATLIALRQSLVAMLNTNWHSELMALRGLFHAQRCQIFDLICQMGRGFSPRENIDAWLDWRTGSQRDSCLTVLGALPVQRLNAFVNALTS